MSSFFDNNDNPPYMKVLPEFCEKFLRQSSADGDNVLKIFKYQVFLLEKLSDGSYNPIGFIPCDLQMKNNNFYF